MLNTLYNTGFWSKQKTDQKSHNKLTLRIPNFFFKDFKMDLGNFE